MGSNERAAIIDFGAPSGRAAIAAIARSPWHLWWWPYPSHPKEGFDDLVVSHPHADHFCGLIRLAGMAANDRPVVSLLRPGATFFHPRVPVQPEVNEFVMRLMALDQLINRLPEHYLDRAIAATSQGPVRRQPLQRGMEVEIGGVPTRVLWPPEVLDDRCTARLRNLVREYDDLAEEAARRGDGRLREAVEAVRESSADISIDEQLYGLGDSQERTAEPRADEALAEARDTYQDGVDDGAPPVADEPRLSARARRLQRAISSGANLLSLVFTTRPSTYVFLGDLDQTLHSAIAGELVDQDHEVILSAHHGTHLGDDLKRVRSRYVVSSVGGSLSARVRPEYADMGMHLRTDQAGDIAIWAAEGESFIETRPVG